MEVYYKSGCLRNGVRLRGLDFDWFRVGARGGYWSFGLHKMPVIAFSTEQVLASEEELFFMELVIVFIVDIILISLCC